MPAERRSTLAASLVRAGAARFDVVSVDASLARRSA